MHFNHNSTGVGEPHQVIRTNHNSGIQQEDDENTDSGASVNTVRVLPQKTYFNDFVND